MNKLVDDLVEYNEFTIPIDYGDKSFVLIEGLDGEVERVTKPYVSFRARSEEDLDLFLKLNRECFSTETKERLYKQIEAKEENIMTCKVKVLDGGYMPYKKHKEDACYDLRARKINKVNPWLYEVNLGVALHPPKGYRVSMYPRSSISKSGWMLANSIGIIDNNYRGELKAYFVPVAEPRELTVTTYGPNNEVYFTTTEFQNEHPFPFDVGDRCVQIELVPYVTDIEFEEIDYLEASDRGSGGFGSTGK